MKRKLFGRIFSCFLAAALMLQPFSAEAAQASTDLEAVQPVEDFEETQSSEDTEEMQLFTDLEEVQSAEELEDTQTSADSEPEPLSVDSDAGRGSVLQEELQTATLENAEGLFQAGSFQTSNRNDSEIALLGVGEEDKWESWDAYIYAQLQARNTEIDVSEFQIPADAGRIKAWYFGAINEHPDLYYVKNSLRYSKNVDNVLVSLIPEYSSVGDDAAFQAATDEALSVLRDDMSELEKAVALHDYIVLNCEYDYDRLQAQSMPDISYTAYGVLVERTAVCQGYALAYKYLLEKAGITYYMVSSESMNHAWNMIVLGGKGVSGRCYMG